MTLRLREQIERLRNVAKQQADWQEPNPRTVDIAAQKYAEIEVSVYDRVLALLPVEAVEGATRAETWEEKYQLLRNRVLYANAQPGSPNHSTACLIWGDSGGADPQEPHGNCNCGALVNWERSLKEKAEAALTDAQQTIARLETELTVQRQFTEDAESDLEALLESHITPEE